MSASARIPAAVCMSLVLHGGALAVIDRMPRGWQVGELTPAAFGAGALQARLHTTTAAPTKIIPVPAARRSAAVGTGRPAFGAVAPLAYLPASELDEKPLIRTPVQPEFPPLSPVAEGRVVLRLFIGENGNVDEIAVLSAEPKRVFEEPAVRAFTGALFTPGRKNGEPVKSALTLELLFGAAQPIALAKPPEGPLFQAPRRGRPNPPTRKENP